MQNSNLAHYIYTTNFNVAHPVRNKILNNAFCKTVWITGKMLHITNNCKYTSLNPCWNITLTVNGSVRYTEWL